MAVSGVILTRRPRPAGRPGSIQATDSPLGRAGTDGAQSPPSSSSAGDRCCYFAGFGSGRRALGLSRLPFAAVTIAVLDLGVRGISGLSPGRHVRGARALTAPRPAAL
jgi:hypothetical protein